MEDLGGERREAHDRQQQEQEHQQRADGRRLSKRARKQQEQQQQQEEQQQEQAEGHSNKAKRKRMGRLPSDSSDDEDGGEHRTKQQQEGHLGCRRKARRVVISTSSSEESEGGAGPAARPQGVRGSEPSSPEGSIDRGREGDSGEESSSEEDSQEEIVDTEYMPSSSSSMASVDGEDEGVAEEGYEQDLSSEDEMLSDRIRRLELMNENKGRRSSSRVNLKGAHHSDLEWGSVSSGDPSAESDPDYKPGMGSPDMSRWEIPIDSDRDVVEDGPAGRKGGKRGRVADEGWTKGGQTRGRGKGRGSRLEHASAAGSRGGATGSNSSRKQLHGTAEGGSNGTGSRLFRSVGLADHHVAAGPAPAPPAAAAASVSGGAGCQNGDSSAGEGSPAGGRTSRPRRRWFWVCGSCVNQLQVLHAILHWEAQLGPFVMELYSQLEGKVPDDKERKTVTVEVSSIP